MDRDLLVLPTGDDWSTWLEVRVKGALATASDQVMLLKQAPAGERVILELWNNAGIGLANALAVSSLLSSVHPEAPVRELAESLEADAHRFLTDLLLDIDLHAQLASLEAEGLDDAAGRVLEDALRSFRRGGVGLDEETRTRLRALNDRETELSQSFSRNIREGRRTFTVPAGDLTGLPQDFIEAHPVDAHGNVELCTDYPDIQPIQEYAEVASTRRTAMTEFFNLAWPENDVVLSELLAVREEKAHLLGYADWPTYDAEIKMIGTGDAIPEFIDRITAESADAAKAEIADLSELAGEPIDVASARHMIHVVKRDRFGVDAQEVRRYFDFTKVRQGLLDVTGRLFGVTYEHVSVPVWHDDVTSYDVRLEGELLGRIHLDLHPREGKFNHAAQFDLVPGVRERQLPEGVLVCNFPRDLMEHRDVVTLFHEFGHLLHHTLAGRHEWVRFSGVATEWDFVEAPSQMLEEWAWDTAVLQSFATDEAGVPIPAELVAKMVAAEEFGKGFMTRTQMFYAAVSYLFHRERPKDQTARLLELQAAYSLLTPLPDTHFHTGFGHLEGYSSGYYTYMWSKVIAKDMFSAFDPADLFDPGVATRYRDTVLAPGGSKDAADLVADFLGRPYDTAAFTRWLDD